jgi:GNAT superfamily N-acetyltransferase
MTSWSRTRPGGHRGRSVSAATVRSSAVISIRRYRVDRAGPDLETASILVNHDIRVASGEDVECLARLRLAMLAENRACKVSDFTLDFSQQTRASLAKELKAKRLISWVAEREGSARGAVSLLVNDVAPLPEDPRRHVGLVKDLYVERQWRGYGIGRALLKSCIEHARASGVRRLQLSTTPMARHLYESVGFSPEESLLEMPLH